MEENFASKDAFTKLLHKMAEFPAYSVVAEDLSTRSILAESGIDPLLAENASMSNLLLWISTPQ